MQAIISSIFLSKTKTKRLNRWLDEYIAHKGTQYATQHNAAFVHFFIESIEEDLDIYDITSEMIFDHLKEKYVGYEKMWKDDARKAINSFLRFWRNKGHKYLPQVYWQETDGR